LFIAIVVEIRGATLCYMYVITNTMSNLQKQSYKSCSLSLTPLSTIIHLRLSTQKVPWLEILILNHCWSMHNLSRIQYPVKSHGKSKFSLRFTHPLKVTQREQTLPFVDLLSSSTIYISVYTALYRRITYSFLSVSESVSKRFSMVPEPDG